MANKMRWRYGAANPCLVAVDSGTVLEIGDFIYLDTDDGKNAAAQADQSSEAANQRLFAKNFLGIAMQASASGETDAIRVATSGTFEFDCPSATYEIGDLVGVDEASSGTALEDQKVAAVATNDLAIGKVDERKASAATVVLVRIQSQVMKQLVADTQYGDDETLEFGDGDDAQLLWSTADASNHVLVLALDNTSQSMHVTDVGAKATDWALGANTHPTIYVHSNTTPSTDYLRIGGHDGTNTYIDAVGGYLSLASDGTEVIYFDTGGGYWNDDFGCYFGTDGDAKLQWSTADASNETLVLALGNSNQALHITDIGANASDWNLSANTHPNVYIHSNTTPITDYLRIGDHDGTEADLDLVGGTSLALKIGGTEYASLRTTGLSIGTYVAPATAGTDHLTIKSTGTAPAGTGANVGHIYCDYETDDDELFYLSGNGGTATQLTT